MKKTRPGGERTAARPLAGFFTGVRLKKILTVLLCLTVGMLAAAAETVPGAYPFGFAWTAAVGGTLAVVSSLAGALIGTVRIPTVGGVYALLLVVMTAARIGTSLWLVSDKLPKPMREWLADHRKRKAESEDRKRTERQETDGVVSALAGIMLREPVRVRAALSAVAALFAGAWSVLVGGFSYIDLFGAVFGMVIAPVGTYLFAAATERKMRTSPFREPGLCLAAAVMALSLHTLSAGWRFDFGVLFGLLAAVAVSLEFGAHRGTVLGLAAGLLTEPALAPAYALAAWAAGGLSSVSRIFAVLAGSAAAVIWAVFAEGVRGLAVVFPPAAAAAVVLLPLVHGGLLKLPPGLFGPTITDGRGRSAAIMSEAAASEMKERIAGLSDGLSAVSTVLGSVASRLSRPGKQEMRSLVETSFETYCSLCRNRARCRGSTVDKAGAAIRAMTAELDKTGAVSAASIPPTLASACWNMGRILDEVNLETARKSALHRDGDRLGITALDLGLAAELLGRLGERQREAAEVDEALSAKMRRLLRAEDFSASTVTVYGSRARTIFVGDVDLGSTRLGGEEIRRLFEGMAGTRLSMPEFSLDGAVLSMKMKTVPKFECHAGTYSCAASSVPMYWSDERSCDADSPGGEAVVELTEEEPTGVCGDQITSFEADGRYYMMLSDGMGSGKEAALTSGMAVGILERLIRSGADLESALRMLNQMIRSTERECSATVDIAEFDLLTGEARFIKSGAAPSFVLRNGSIFRLQSKTVPIGIMRALDAESISFTLEPGDSVVMMSDGVAHSYEDAPWLLDLMTADDTILRGEERAAARKIVGEAARRGSLDDITCGIVRIGERGENEGNEENAAS